MQTQKAIVIHSAGCKRKMIDTGVNLISFRLLITRVKIKVRRMHRLINGQCDIMHTPKAV